MAKDYTAVASIHYFIDETETIDHIILSEVEDFSDAMHRIEKCYGSTLETVSITLMEGPFINMSARYIDMFMTGQLEE